MKLNFKLICLCLVMLISLSSSAEQAKIKRVEEMPDLPRPFHIIDFQGLAKKFDQTVFDFNATGESWPLIWWDKHGDNFYQPTFGLYTTIGDIRQGPLASDGTVHEALASMGAVLGATLVGIDKSSQENVNYVGMLRNYFNRDTGWNIMQNNTNPIAGAQGGGYARDWWYDVFPNLLFYGIYDKYPYEKDFDGIAKSIADKFLAADVILNGNYNHSYFDYGQMVPKSSWICGQPDVAAGHSWVLYSAFKKFGEQKYLQGAIHSLKSLALRKENPSYEVLMPFGAYMAARLNAEQGENFDVEKMLEWTFNGAVCRKGWGVLRGRWNGFDISGLVGSTVQAGGYAFVMNTYDMAWPLVPLVRYDQSYAKVIGKWMLNAANAIKLAYPEYASPDHQTLPHLASFTKGVIAYEGIIKKASYPEAAKTTKAPIAQGDGPKWITGNPPTSQFSIYGSSHVGIFGSIIQPTNEPGILQLNLLATDFFHDPAYPTYLYYNPYPVLKKVAVPVDQDQAVDLYNTVTGKFLPRDASTSTSTSIEIPPTSAAVIVLVPAGGKVTHQGRALLVNGVVVDYKSQ